MTDNVSIHPLPSFRPVPDPANGPKFRFWLERMLDWVDRHGPHGGGGPTEFDCLIDAALPASTPIAAAGAQAPSYRGVQEAMNDFAANSRTRMWALVEPGTYDDTANSSTAHPGDVMLFGHGGWGCFSWYAYVTAWSIGVLQMMNGQLRIGDNFTVGEGVFRRCGIVGHGTLPVGSYKPITFTAGYLFCEDVTFFNNNADTGGLTFVADDFVCIGNCEYSHDGSANLMLKANRRGHFAGNVFQGAFAPGSVVFRGGVVTLDLTGVSGDRYGGGATQNILTCDQGVFYGSVYGMDTVQIATDWHGAIEATGNAVVTISGGNVGLDLVCRTLNLSAGQGSIRAQVSDAVVVTGGYWLDAQLEHTAAACSHAEWVKVSNVTRSSFSLGGVPVTTGGKIPFTLDASTAKNFLTCAGDTDWAAAGVDAGTLNNVTRT